MVKVISVIYTKRQKSIAENVQNNGFMMYIVIEKINVSLLPKDIVYSVKKSYYRNLV